MKQHGQRKIMSRTRCAATFDFLVTLYRYVKFLLFLFLFNFFSPILNSKSFSRCSRTREKRVKKMSRNTVRNKSDRFECVDQLQPQGHRMGEASDDERTKFTLSNMVRHEVAKQMAKAICQRKWYQNSYLFIKVIGSFHFRWYKVNFKKIYLKAKSTFIENSARRSAIHLWIILPRIADR